MLSQPQQAQLQKEHDLVFKGINHMNSGRDDSRLIATMAMGFGTNPSLPEHLRPVLSQPQQAQLQTEHDKVFAHRLAKLIKPSKHPVEGGEFVLIFTDLKGQLKIRHGGPDFVTMRASAQDVLNASARHWITTPFAIPLHRATTLFGKGNFKFIDELLPPIKHDKLTGDELTGVRLELREKELRCVLSKEGLYPVNTLELQRAINLANGL